MKQFYLPTLRHLYFELSLMRGESAFFAWNWLEKKKAPDSAPDKKSFVFY
jgi:hypothetical protein